VTASRLITNEHTIASPKVNASNSAGRNGSRSRNYKIKSAFSSKTGLEINCSWWKHE